MATDHKKIQTAIGELEKIHGKNCVIRYGTSTRLVVPVITTGVLSIDEALGIGGFARGRIVEVYGPESSGKTTLTLHVIAEAQKAGGAAAFVDAEHALDPKYAAALGVDMANLYVSQPDNGEQALEIAQRLISTGEFDIVVVDSVAALVPKAELEGDMGDPQMGLQARLMSQAMRKLTANVSHTKTCLVFINQIREKIGVMFGNPETTTGGRALKFYSSQRIDVRKSTTIKEGDKVIGFEAKVKIVKNKLAAPYTEANPQMMFGHGYDPSTDLLRVAERLKLVEKAGQWYSYKGERLGQGIGNAAEFLTEHQDIFKKLMAEARGILFPVLTAPVAEEKK